MKTLRFKVGDLARVVRDKDGFIADVLGEVVEITGLGAYGRYNGVAWTNDYSIRIRGLNHYGADDCELEPYPADFIPPAVRSIFNVTPNQGLPVGPRPKEKAVGR